MALMMDVLLAYFLRSVNINCLKSLRTAVTKITRLSLNINIKCTATFVKVGRGGGRHVVRSRDHSCQKVAS